jgi:serine/threonine protein kinase
MTEERVRSYMLQLLTGLAHMHARGWVHRDLKTANLLVTAGNVVKIADFGLAKPLEPGREMTPRVVTLWYRSPELLFQDRSAGPGVDVWSAGCIFGELLTGREVFVGRDELAQLHAIYKLCGVPDTATWPGLAQLQAYIAMRPKQKFVPQFKSRFGQ